MTDRNLLEGSGVVHLQLHSARPPPGQPRHRLGADLAACAAASSCYRFYRDHSNIYLNTSAAHARRVRPQSTDWEGPSEDGSGSSLGDCERLVRRWARAGAPWTHAGRARAATIAGKNQEHVISIS